MDVNFSQQVIEREIEQKRNDRVRFSTRIITTTVLVGDVMGMMMSRNVG